MRSQFLRGWLLVLSPADRHGVESHLACELNAQMSQSADAKHCYHVADTRTCVTKRVEHGDARAHEGSRFLRRQFLRDRRHRCSRCDQVLAIATIEIHA